MIASSSWTCRRRQTRPVWHKHRWTSPNARAQLSTDVGPSFLLHPHVPCRSAIIADEDRAQPGFVACRPQRLDARRQPGEHGVGDGPPGIITADIGTSLRGVRCGGLEDGTVPNFLEGG